MGVISNVQSVIADGFFDGNFGRMFKFNYTFADGVQLQANHKTEDGFWAVGSQVEYNITKTSPQYGNSGKVGKVQEQQYQQPAPVAGQPAAQQAAPVAAQPVQQQYAAPVQQAAPVAAPVQQAAPVQGRTAQSPDNKNAAFALSYAKDLLTPLAEQYTDIDKLGTDATFIADKFYNWLNSK